MDHQVFKLAVQVAMVTTKSIKAQLSITNHQVQVANLHPKLE
jgi:hypothetical protein